MLLTLNSYRKIKKLSWCVAKHAGRYRKLLEDSWQKTEWSYAQTQQVLKRIDDIMEQFPTAIKQAHDRIIGERQGLLLTEQAAGLIIDWELFKDQPPSDSKLLEPTIKRIKKYYGALRSISTDRGFNDKHNDAFLKQQKIYQEIPNCCKKSWPVLYFCRYKPGAVKLRHALVFLRIFF